MAIIKCKMCGGDLILKEGQSVAECEYCGSRQTVPAADNEKKLTLFGRANRLRSTCDFDKAAGIYESIVADFPGEAEAYWGLVLCKYGIEYVDDPATGKKIPTCHRSSFDSVMDDSNFEQAMENADEVALRVYREEAKQIEKIRKGILEASSNEQPYDIFICYKETAVNGDRTVDSLLAQDIYDALTSKGYRVFFSRITLEDKLGEAYEPYIFAALNSAKIMLAVGTCYEHYNAVWVKNEWSRYLKIIAQDKNKYLIPCYKGIDAYDIPKEFAHLQGQDMGKVGAMQDLLRGVEKLLPKQKSVAVVQERVVVGGSGNNKIASLLDRGNMALEDGDWVKADSFFEDVLNNDSKNAQAYLGKTLAMERCRTIDAFARKRKDASQNVHGEKLELQPNRAHVDEMVKQFSLPGYVEQSEIRRLYDFDLSYHSDVAERKQQYRNEEHYWANHKQLSRAEKFAVGAVAENLEREKKALFAALSERVKKAENAESAAKKSVLQRYEQHLQKADAQADELFNNGVSQREKNYQELLQIAKTSSDVAQLKDTAKKFDKLGSYQDSKNLADHCRKRAAEEQAKMDAEAERQRLIKEKQKKARQAKVKLIAIISAFVAVAAIAAVIVVTKVIIPNNNYNQAVELMDNGQYEEAIAAFEALDGYKDSAEQIVEGQNRIAYENAEALLMSGDRSGAIEAFNALGSYKDASQRVTAILSEVYSEAETYLASGDNVHAAMAFGFAADYLDARQRSMELWKDITAPNSIALTLLATVGLQSNGTVIAAGNNKYDQLDVNEWKNVISISADYSNTYGLLADGTVLVAGKDSHVSEWSDIVSISSGDAVVGLKIDGTVVSTGTPVREIENWTDIIAVSAGGSAVAGLKSDGTVVIAPVSENRVYDVPTDGQWTNIVAVDAGSSHTVALRADGTVLAVGSDNNEGQCDVSGWKDIVAVSAGNQHTVGLKSDGTVVAIGHNDYDQCEVSEWTDIVIVAAGPYFTVGAKADGTLVATGSDKEGKTEIDGWQDILLPADKVANIFNQKANTYAEAEKLLTEKKYDDAAKLFSSLGNYEDAAEQAMAASKLAKIVAYANAQAGDILVFGTYNSKDLQWRVLTRKGNSVLMIAQSCVDERRFQSNQNDPKYYKDSPIRKFLNETFFKEAFSVELQSYIEERTLQTTGGNVKDKVFLLSDKEANKYFSSDEDRKPADGKSWYLRTVNSVLLDVLNYRKPIAMMVNGLGQVYQNDWTVDYARGIRPAMWIDVSSYVEQLEQQNNG